MKQKKVLQVCYYPIKNVVAGGQLRVSQLSRLLEELDFKNEFLGIYPNRNDGWTTDISINKSMDEWVFRLPYDFEMRLSDVIQSSTALHKQILSKVEKFNPDLIWFEHPFLWPIFKEYLKGKNIQIIYSSHNVEWCLKKQLLDREKIKDYFCLDRLYNVERDILSLSNLVVCCSESDKEVYEKHGAINTIVIPNGSFYPELLVKEDLTRFNKFELSTINNNLPNFIYISSWHEPNWFGLRDLLLKNMVDGGLFSDCNLILVGDICRLYSDRKHEVPHNKQNIFCAGRVSNEEKSILFKYADIVVLPITSGGGTNLKTAEALLSSNLVVGTDIAFRGFEKFKNVSGVYVESSYDSFEIALNQAVSKIRMTENKKSIKVRNKLRHHLVDSCSWDNIIYEAKNKLETII